MEHLAWNRDWEMGDPRLDGQHQAMVAGINRLAEAIDRGRTDSEIRKAITFLLVYVDTHFRQEEELMEQQGFHELEEHRLKHQACSRQINTLLRHFRTGNPGTLAGLVTFFEYWLVDHLQGADSRLAGFLRGETVA